ncbi:MAG: 30S ribosomal protein S6 [Spirochaetota bacterium]|nr:30S ribosomal protein S6 [Spirochaetota bacterium]
MTYELTVILRISDSVESVKEKVTQILHKHGVSVITEESWDIKKLAYQIENETEGYYLFMTIESPKDAISKITTDFRLIDDILRYLFVKFDKKEDAKSKAEEDSDGN